MGHEALVIDRTLFTPPVRSSRGRRHFVIDALITLQLRADAIDRLVELGDLLSKIRPGHLWRLLFIVQKFREFQTLIFAQQRLGNLRREDEPEDAEHHAPDGDATPERPALPGRHDDVGPACVRGHRAARPARAGGRNEGGVWD